MLMTTSPHHRRESPPGAVCASPVAGADFGVLAMAQLSVGEGKRGKAGRPAQGFRLSPLRPQEDQDGEKLSNKARSAFNKLRLLSDFLSRGPQFFAAVSSQEAKPAS
ncbi:hypothetical protein SCA03_45750 [Streptomyces cacaoi]|uniref:Uncharacterized protein n=1 Tax=Streptomyces cacaoi TaxID=1898 RepID=A0A4Y3R3D2_STRCI|nr:hypothetical protein SCA03_45750 [Streptomyces cacaoi]